MSQEQSKKESLRSTLRERTSSYIVAALGIVAGLAWNDAIRAFIDYLFPVSASSIVAKFVYAIVITIVIVLLSSWIIRYLKPDETNSTNNP